MRILTLLLVAPAAIALDWAAGRPAIAVKPAVEFDDALSSIDLTLVKELAVMGHPPNRISIDEKRKTLGIAQ